MKIPKKTSIIPFGGTISSTLNDEGKLVPTNKLGRLIYQAGFKKTDISKNRPVIIDSIDFDHSVNLAAYIHSIEEELKKNDCVIVAGGTDTLVWYSTMIIRDLERRGVLQPGNGKKVVFCSSMKPMDDEEHIINIFRAAAVVKDLDLCGGFALAAEDDAGSKFTLHDVNHDFDKISGELTYALRSSQTVGKIRDGKFIPNSAYTAPHPFEIQPPDRNGRFHYARIAPPLLRGHPLKTQLQFMKEMGVAEPAYDGLILEGIPTSLKDAEDLCDMVQWLKHERGMRVIFCNPLRFDTQQETMHASIKLPTRESRINTIIQALEKAGSEMVTALPKDAYIDAVFRTPRRLMAPNGHSSPEFSHEDERMEVFGLRYVPHIPVMQEAIAQLAPLANNMMYCALPHEVMPDALANVLSATSGFTHHYVGAEYTGTRHKRPGGGFTIEGSAPNPYAAGQDTRKLLTKIDAGGHHVVHRLLALIQKASQGKAI